MNKKSKYFLNTITGEIVQYAHFNYKLRAYLYFKRDGARWRNVDRLWLKG